MRPCVCVCVCLRVCVFTSFDVDTYCIYTRSFVLFTVLSFIFGRVAVTAVSFGNRSYYCFVRVFIYTMPVCNRWFVFGRFGRRLLCSGSQLVVRFVVGFIVLVLYP